MTPLWVLKTRTINDSGSVRSASGTFGLTASLTLSNVQIAVAGVLPSMKLR